MQPTGGIKAAIGFLLVAVAGAVAFGALQRKMLTNTRADLGHKLDECNGQLTTEQSDHATSDKSLLATTTQLVATQAELDEVRHQKEDADARLAVFKSITEKFRKMIDAGKLKVEMRHGRMVVKLPAGVLFPSGRADLSKDGQNALTDVAHILKQFPDRRFEVAGHTDNVPVGPPSPFKNNLELSTARALTVASYLLGVGMNPAKLSAAAYSEYQPIASNAHEAGRQENRRIEIVLLPNLSELPPSPDDADAGAGGNAKNDAGAK
ncbi:MAG: OmpA family protein [Polyangiaceae bacterium]